MVRHSRRLSRTLRNNLGTLAMLGGLAIFLVALVASISFVVRSFMFFYEWHWLAGLLDWVYAVITLVGGTGVAIVLIYRIERSFIYEDVRRDLVTLFRTAAVSAPVMAATIERHEKRKYGDNDTIRGTEVIGQGLRHDAALQIFSLAQICLRAADVEPEDAPLILL
jgi:hypothetical protein